MEASVGIIDGETDEMIEADVTFHPGAPASSTFCRREDACPAGDDEVDINAARIVLLVTDAGTPIKVSDLSDAEVERITDKACEEAGDYE